MKSVEQLRRGILQEMIELRSVYGETARMCINDPVLERKFLYECNDEIKENKKAMEQHLGVDVVRKIILFVSESRVN